jgi:undecaprenyl diphosphate synthase
LPEQNMNSPEDGKPAVPVHVAIIMDGNGRWARQRGLPRIKGHEQGSESVRAAVKACREAGVRYLTLYAFSVENWVRPRDEVDHLMRLLGRTRAYDEAHLILAVSYGGRTEIAHAAREIARKARDGELDPETVDERTVAAHLYAPDVPDPDLMIRTSGEMRISNFLLWQLCYAELYVTDVLWPDFREAEFAKALEAYAHRKRRFGDVE